MYFTGKGHNRTGSRSSTTNKDSESDIMFDMDDMEPYDSNDQVVHPDPLTPTNKPPLDLSMPDLIPAASRKTVSSSVPTSPDLSTRMVRINNQG